MSDVSTAFAKLAGIRTAVTAALYEDTSRNPGMGEKLFPRSYNPLAVAHYFDRASAQLAILKQLLPDLFDDFVSLPSGPDSRVAATSSQAERPVYSRGRLERLVRDIDQVFEIRANSQLQSPSSEPSEFKRVFITHGRSNDWREVQSMIERDANLLTMELAQEPNSGMTVLEKLIDGASRCDSAVIVMTGDDTDSDGKARSRENVMHEIGFFQGKYGRSKVCLLHEEGVSIPSNLSGVVYISYPKGLVSAGFHVLSRELKSMYSR